MASLLKLTDKPRTLPWRAKIKGGKVRYFANRDEAKLWATEEERSLRLTGLPLSIGERSKFKVGDLIERYLREITPTKGSSVPERTVLERLLGINNLKSRRNPICDLTLAQVSSDDAYKYVQDRLKAEWNGKRIKPSTAAKLTRSVEFSTSPKSNGTDSYCRGSIIHSLHWMSRLKKRLASVAYMKES